MRSFHRLRVPVILSAAFVAALLSGCPSEEDDEYVCGDGVCEVADGENEFNCSEDCATEEPCGDGFCSPNDGENASNCPADCQATPTCGDGLCNGSETASSCPGDCATCTGNFPVDCQDGTGCWSQGTNCSSEVFTCGGLRRCASTADWAFCCGGVFVTCPSFAPYYCPQDGLCYPQIPNCFVGACTVALGDC